MRNFFAFLVGSEEVPPVRTKAFGQAFFKLSRDGKKLRFRLVVNNIRGVTQAHIHMGPRGVNGPVVVFLFGPNKFGISVRRGVIEGTLTRDDLVGPLQGKSLRDLIALFRNGNAYVNVHTERFPDGEIRGQVRKVHKRSR